MAKVEVELLVPQSEDDHASTEPDALVEALVTAIKEKEERQFHEYLDKVVKMHGTHVGATLDECGYLVIAAKVGSIPMMEALLQHGADVNSFFMKKVLFSKKELSPLHAAVGYNHLDAVKYLVEHEANVNIRNNEGLAPLHMAKHLEVAQFLVHNGADVNAKTLKERTPLHMAEELELVKFLVRSGADVNAQTNTGVTPLLLANKLELVEFLLESGADVNAKSNDKIAVLHRVYYDLELVKLVVGAGADVNAIDNDGLTALHLAVGGDYVEVCKCLIEQNADVNIKTGPNEDSLFIYACKKGSIETLKYFLHKNKTEMPSNAVHGLSPTSWDNKFHNGLHLCVQANLRDVAEVLLESEFGEKLLSNSTLRSMIARMPDVAEKALHLCVTTNESKERAIDPTSDSYDVTFDYRHLENYYGIKDLHSTKFTKCNHLLYLIMKQGNSNLLRHPLVISLLDYKWKKFARYIFFLNLLFYVIFLMFLTSFGLVVLNPLENTCIEVFNQSLNGSTPEDCEGLSTHKYHFLIVAAAITIVFAILRTLGEVFQLCRQPLDYLQDWVNWLEIPLYTCSIIFSFIFNTPCLCVHYWQWQIGVVSVFLAWIVLITFLQKWPLTGVYVLMFLNITGTFLKIVFLAQLLVIAFALAFYMLLSDPNETRTPFSNPARAIVKVMAMTTGELDYDDLYHQEEGLSEIAFPPVSFLLWIIFLVLMPVLLSNLLVGLAVGDVNALQKVASEKRIELQIDLILNIEELLAYLPIYHYCKVKQQDIKPNNPASQLPQCCRTDKLKTVLTWAADLYSKWLVTSDYLVSGKTIASAIKPPPTSMEEQVKLLNSKMMDQQNMLLSEKLNTVLQQLLDKIKENEEQSKAILEKQLEQHSREQAQGMEKQLKLNKSFIREQIEEQSKKMAEHSEQLAVEVAALREALEKVLVYKAKK